MLLAVGGKMLYAHADLVALDALDQTGGQFGRQVGVLAEILEIAAAEGRTLDVDRRTEIDGHLLVLAGNAQTVADLT